MVECHWAVSTPPTWEPLTVAEAKAQIRSVQDQENGVVQGYIRAARHAAEEHLGVYLPTQTITLALSDFADCIPLPMAAPLQSVTSVKYYDTNGTQQTLSASIYTVDTSSRPGRVALAADQSWPELQSNRLASRVEIIYVAGYTAPNLIPPSVLQGMRILIGNMDADRDGMEAGTEQAMRVAKTFWTDRVFWVPPDA